MSVSTPRNHEKQLAADEFIVSKTDERGKPHSILRHPDMQKVVFQLLWDRLKAKKEIFAYVKNLCKDGSFYWVYANVTVTLDKDVKVIDLHSVCPKPSKKSIKDMVAQANPKVKF